eukprot:TRINITY_DN10291_c1_g1_i1.p1 TRINITY_DN10291_c1_g1~~TRINITY_DN10291_c1_g1_i1.p1  ORF type:complete len:140 (+),score=28.98 TRINITY_DN10291_c1_g1_i1:84-503(+)
MLHHSRQISLSSFCLQLSLLITNLVGLTWFLGCAASLIYKGVTFPYPEGVIGSEAFFLVVAVVVEYICNSLATRGNMLEFRGCLVVSTFLAIVQVICILYFLLWQVYVVQMDFYLSVIYIATKGHSALWMVYGIISFSW